MDIRFAAALAACLAAGLGALWMTAPGRDDLLAGASAGAGFGALLATGSWEMIRRARRRSPEAAIRIFLAAMTVKMLAYAAFLPTIALATTLSLAAVAVALVGATLLGEAFAIEGILRAPPAGGAGVGAPPANETRDRN
jgi:hypothetical protein